MKVENKEIKITIGDQVYKTKNMILDTYLNDLFSSQLNIAHNYCKINSCFLKFEDVLDVTPESILEKNDFDVQFINNRFGTDVKVTSTTSNGAELKYTFDIDTAEERYITGTLKNFINKKLTGIGFGKDIFYDAGGETFVIFAYVDVSDMNIILNTQENFSISRTDYISSDGEVYGFDFPLHLINDVAYIDGARDDGTSMYYTKAQLYKIGFGGYRGVSEEEYDISSLDYDVTDNSITIQIIRNKKQGIYPSNNLQLGFTPLPDNSKSINFIYRLYRQQANDPDGNYLDQYYSMGFYNDKHHTINIKLKIER